MYVFLPSAGRPRQGRRKFPGFAAPKSVHSHPLAVQYARRPSNVVIRRNRSRRAGHYVFRNPTFLPPPGFAVSTSRNAGTNNKMRRTPFAAIDIGQRGQRRCEGVARRGMLGTSDFRRVRRTGNDRARRRRLARPASIAGPEATPSPVAADALTKAERRIGELERKIGQHRVELDFFRHALRQVSGKRRPSDGPGATASTPSSRR